MGGKSSSSSSQSTQQTDQRIAAQDSAVVLQQLSNTNISVTDGGAIAANKDVSLAGLNLSEATLDNVSEFASSVIDLIRSDHTATLNALNASSAQAYSFADKTTQDSNARTFDQIAPWLVVGVSVVALSYAWRNK